MPTTEYKQVGRNCLADFIGCDPHLAASMAEILASAGSYAEACEDGEGMGNGTKTYRTLSSFLPYVALSIRTSGWLPKGKAYERDGHTECATASIAWNTMIEAEEMSRTGKTIPEAMKPTEKDAEVVAKAIEYLNSHFDMEDAAILALSDYEHNLRVAFLSGVVESKTSGILASAINYASRAQEKTVGPVDFSASQFVGTLGERAIFMGLKCIFPGFGGRPVVFADAAGNKVSAWNPGFVVAKDGVYNVKATPVKQDEYKGVKSTMLNRMVLATEKDLAPKAPRKPRAKKVAAAVVEVVNG
jgi:hypothetical protein